MASITIQAGHRKMASTIGLYFGSHSKADVNALRARLNYLFGVMGYATEDGSQPYRGGLPAGLLAIDAGEIALVLLPDEQRAWVREWLYQQSQALRDNQPQSVQSLALAEAMATIADALTAAMDRQIEAELDDD